MRDIIGHRPSQHQHRSEDQPLPTIAPPSFFERVVGGINEFGGKLNRATNKTEAAQVIAPVVLSYPTQIKANKPKRRLPRGVVTKAGRAVKRAAGVAGEELKKPGRKTSVVHSLALGALFALVLGGTPWAKTLQDTNATAQTGTVRRYLPNIASDVKLTPVNANNAIAASGQKLNLYGWITPWNVNSGTTDVYNAASAFWLTVGGDGASVTPKADWSTWTTYRQNHPINQAFLTVSGDPDNTYKALSDLTVQSQHIAALLDTVKTEGFDGIDIDYEGLGSANRDLFSNFIRNLTTVFHQQGKKVAVTLEARIANQVPMDWQTIGGLADEVRIMAYDYHSHETATPGPIAPVAWVAEITAYASERIDPSKLIIGLGNYGYDWTAPTDANPNWEGTGISYDQAVSLSKSHTTTVVHSTGIDERGYDIGTVPNFTYVDDQGQQHQVWFEDATSIQEKVNAISTYKIKGIMFWSVGAGDPTLSLSGS